MTRADNHSFGVFKPVGHIVISVPGAEQAAAAADAIGRAGATDVRRYSDREMIEQIDRDLEHASGVASVGQEVNLVKAHRALAERGYHWLVVRAADDEQARRIADAARGAGAETAQHYGRFVIEELIQHAGDLPQVGESPDRGLDPQTPSGTTAERADLRPAEPATEKEARR
jgi:hypothetical protein